MTLVIAAAACAGPSRSDDDYTNKAAQTAQAMGSLLETARLGADAVEKDRTIAPFTSVLMREMEGDASGVQSAFLTRQPPSATAVELRARVAPILNDATSVLADLRIAAYRTDVDALSRAAERIPAITETLGSTSMQAFAEAAGEPAGDDIFGWQLVTAVER